MATPPPTIVPIQSPPNVKLVVQPLLAWCKSWHNTGKSQEAEASATACQIGCYSASAEPKLSPNWCQWLLTCQGSQLLHCSLCLQARTPLRHWLILFLPSTFARAMVTTELPTSAQSFSPLSLAPHLASRQRVFQMSRRHSSRSCSLLAARLSFGLSPERRVGSGGLPLLAAAPLRVVSSHSTHDPSLPQGRTGGPVSGRC